MADDTKPNPLSAQNTDASENNKNVAAKLEQQDISGHSTASTEAGIQDASDALDALAKQHEEAAKAKADGDEPPVVEPKPEKKADAPAATPAAETETAEQKAAREKADTEKAELSKKADELFKDSPSLAPNAAPKSHEAFTAIKVKAAKEITELNTKLETATKQIEELKKQTGKISPEQEKELAEVKTLKEKLAKFDVAYDPKFKEFDGKVKEAEDFIYAQLKRSPAVSEAVIEQIKKLGGPASVDLEKLFDAIKDPTMKRLVEAKVADIEVAKYNKQQAITKTQENVAEYLKEKETATAEGETNRVRATATEVDRLIEGLDWFKDKDASKGTDEEKKSAAEYNQYLQGLQKDMAAACKDNSEKMKAVLIIGAAQLINLQKVHAQLKADMTKVTKERDDAIAKVDRIKQAGRSRLPESAAPQGGTPQVQKPKNDFTTPTTDALDSLAKQVMEERNAKSGVAA